MIGRPIFDELPTPHVLFCPILLDPPPPLKSDIIYERSQIWTDVEDPNDDATEGFLQIMQSDTLGVFKF